MILGRRDVPRADAGRFRDPVRIGWIGSSVNLHELDVIAPALREISRTRRVVLVVISDEAVSVDGVVVENVPWSLDSQADRVADLDIGIMPLADSPWSRGKCSYKLLQYMAAGLPAVASPVGMNVEVVEDGRSGLFATETRGWVGALERLMDDPALAGAVGREGRKVVESRFGYPEQARRWKEFLVGVSGVRVDG